MGTSMVVSVPYRGELADRPVALAAAEWEWLSRHVQEGMPTPCNSQEGKCYRGKEFSEILA